MATLSRTLAWSISHGERNLVGREQRADTLSDLHACVE